MIISYWQHSKCDFCCKYLVSFANQPIEIDLRSQKGQESCSCTLHYIDQLILSEWIFECRWCAVRAYVDIRRLYIFLCLGINPESFQGIPVWSLLFSFLTQLSKAASIPHEHIFETPKAAYNGSGDSEIPSPDHSNRHADCGQG